jgi:hypothetical protein
MLVIHKCSAQSQAHLLFLLLKLRVVGSSCWQVLVRKPILVFFRFLIVRPIYLLFHSLSHWADFARESLGQIVILLLILNEPGNRLPMTQNL